LPDPLTPDDLLPLPTAAFQLFISLVAVAGGDWLGYAIMQDIAERTAEASE
jgi:hypothetical protein